MTLVVVKCCVTPTAARLVGEQYFVVNTMVKRHHTPWAIPSINSFFVGIDSHKQLFNEIKHEFYNNSYNNNLIFDLYVDVTREGYKCLKNGNPLMTDMIKYIHGIQFR